MIVLPRMNAGVLLADPPWSFSTYSKPQGQIPQRTEVQHYPVMSREELLDMDMGRAAAKDCALFMWVVDSHLDQALELGRAWGFTYKTIAFVWEKTLKGSTGADDEPLRMGLGKWTRKESELCLLFTCGKPKRLSGGVRQVIRAPRREHSRKPDEQYERIEALVAGPYLEIFSRTDRPGWTSWGNQTGKFNQSMQFQQEDRHGI